jgi:hypothetical protein
LFAGAARVAAVGPPDDLTFTADELVQVARTRPEALIVPLHIEGWEHFSESRSQVVAAFAAAGLTDGLRLLDRGETLTLPFSS